MQRLVEKELIDWKNSDRRKPLMVLGIRQCGKTYTLKEFGRKYYRDVAYFDFEYMENSANIFRDLDPHRIIKELGLIGGKTITPDTLIIFDEIQKCYPAITSLKYFLQDAPEYHVVAAGSLLGVVLAERSFENKDNKKDDTVSEKYSFPVGKVSFLRMWPMCFGEYVLARAGQTAFDYLDGLGPDETMPEWVMSRMNDLYLEFLLVGGMPESVSVWCDTEDMGAVRKVQSDIISSYQKDMGKYSGDDYNRITQLWRSVAYQVAEGGDRFNLKKAGGEMRNLRSPIQWLLDADLVRRCWQVNGASVPPMPRGGIFFKLYYPDVGLLSCQAGLDFKVISSSDKSSSGIRGALAENFVLNELSYALGIDGDFHYWAREKGESEVDFQLQFHRDIVPVEVKSGNVNNMPSLKMYCDTYSPKAAFVISKKNVRMGSAEEYTFVPLYMVWKFGMYAGALGLDV